MKKSEMDWKKWYLSTTGMEWSDEEENESPTGLTSAQKKVGDLLYRQYLAEKKIKEDMQYDLAEAKVAKESAERNAVAAEKTLQKHLKESNKANRLDGLGVADSVVAEGGRQLKTALGNIDQRYQSLRNQLRTEYGERMETAAKQTADGMKEVETEVNQRAAEVWKEMKKSMSERLPDMLSADAHSYRPEGLQALREEIEKNRTRLGVYAEDAMDWVNSLEVQTVEKGEVLLKTEFGDSIVSAEDYRRADSVKYEGGAGVKITGADIWKVSFEGETFRLLADDFVDEKTNATLHALADSKKMSVNTGTVLYLGGKLYVFDGVSSWRGVKSFNAKTGTKGLNRLLYLIGQKEYEDEENA